LRSRPTTWDRQEVQNGNPRGGNRGNNKNSQTVDYGPYWPPRGGGEKREQSCSKKEKKKKMHNVGKGKKRGGEGEGAN